MFKVYARSSTGIWRIEYTGSFYVNVSPSGGPEVGYDDREDAMETDGARGHRLAHFVKVDDNVISELSWRRVSNQKRQCLGDSFRGEGLGGS